MASFPRGLGVVLTLCMAVTRPSSAIRNGSPDSSPWWDTPEYREFTAAARIHRADQNFAALESVYQAGYNRARALGNTTAEISYLSNLGTTRMLQARYAPAVSAYLEASDLAEGTGDWSSEGGIAVNLASIYQRIGDIKAALTALERGMSAIDRMDRTGRIPTPPYEPQLLMRLRSVRDSLRDGATGELEKPSYRDAIEAARRTADPTAEAAAWDFLGNQQMVAGNLEEAEASLGRALWLRGRLSTKSLSFSWASLGRLRLAQAAAAKSEESQRKAKEALSFTHRAILAGQPGPPAYSLLHQRGQAREALGQTEAALIDFRAAADGAMQLNRGVPAARSLVTAANVALQHEVLDSFVGAAARQALETGSQDWTVDAFLALETNRAASLRESRELAPALKKRLPPAYWETLERLAEEESRNLVKGTNSPESKRLHLEITEMESKAGAGVSVMLAENFRTRTSLNHFQQGLGRSDLFLSFYLGKRESYLWAVTRDRIRLHRLPAEEEIRKDVGEFKKAILGGLPGAGERLGADLYKRLFGSLRPEDAAKTSWLLSLDGALFDLPFAALVSGYSRGRPVYAAEQHSTQRVPSAVFLAAAATAGAGRAGQDRFLGVGDPIYNLADTRRNPSRMSWVSDWTAGSEDNQGQMNRLVNSSRELHRSSESWQGETGPGRPVEMLEGGMAQRAVFLNALKSGPSTIHLATHVLNRPGAYSAGESDQTFLVFSLGKSGKPDLLSTAEIGMLDVPGALVVMTGCATGIGEARPGAGLLGLTHAWMMAGAKALVATNWPVEDTDGDLIPEFYRQLRMNPPAEALRLSQVNMIHSGTWQASPSYWAAYQVAGAGR